jgi:TIGR03009 family protein
MRRLGPSLAAVLLAAPLLPAQAPPAGGPAAAAPAAPQPFPPKAAPLNPNDPLDKLLIDWEAAMKSHAAIAAVVTKKDKNVVAGTEDLYKGDAKFLKPGMALLHYQKEGRANVYEKYLLRPEFVLRETSADKTVRIYQLPKPQPGQNNDDNVMGILLGMKAAEAKARYQLAFAKPPESDPYYYYVDILPIFPADKQEFKKARLVLLKQRLLPRQLWFLQPNGDQTEWNLERVTTGPESGVRPADFEWTQAPQGWKVEQIRPDQLTAPGGQGAAPGQPAAGPAGAAPGQLQPRVVRPND